jgi:nucleotide-binding universal stress UspA family protein|nr:universal stress protein [Brevundimonas diminuta]
MGLKLIIALASGSGGDERAAAFAARLAVQHEARAEILPTYANAAADMIGLGAALGVSLSQTSINELLAAESEVLRHIERDARTAADEAGAAFGTGEGVSRVAVLGRSPGPVLNLCRQTALADLVVVAHDHAGASPMRRHLGELLLGYGAPVLVGRGDPDGLTGAAVIAWDGSPQAGRAVRAALPLLAKTSAVHIAQCVSGLDVQGCDPDPGRLKTYLKLHSVKAGDVIQAEGADEGVALLAAAQSRQAGLFVAGAWGRSRVQETIFGGATRTFLQEKDGPSLLLMH